MGMGTELRMLGWKFDTKLQNRGPVYRFFGAQFSSLLHFQATPQPTVTHALVGSNKVAIYSGSVHHGHRLPKEAMSQCEAWCWLLDKVVEMSQHCV